jgi:hypothetical protein
MAREKIFNDTGRSRFVNERRLFHGSKYAEEIARHGFLDSKSQAGLNSIPKSVFFFN